MRTPREPHSSGAPERLDTRAPKRCSQGEDIVHAPMKIGDYVHGRGCGFESRRSRIDKIACLWHATLRYAASEAEGGGLCIGTRTGKEWGNSSVTMSQNR